jgi:hypothetical protein
MLTIPPYPQTPAASTSNSIPRVTSETQRHAKPKRLKAHTVTSKSYSIPLVPRDKKGKPMLPLNVGIMTVICLGDVCMREHFHTERYIFPVGYEVTRYAALSHGFGFSLFSLMTCLAGDTYRQSAQTQRLSIIVPFWMAEMAQNSRSSHLTPPTDPSLQAQLRVLGPA